MKVKVGNKIYDGEVQPVMVILSEEDKKNIKHMKKNFRKYCSFPKGMDRKTIEMWVDEDE
jgi:hypothetical protein